MTSPDNEEHPTDKVPPRWVGSAPIPDGITPKRRRGLRGDTFDLPAEPEPEIRYVEVPVYREPPRYPQGHPPHGYRPPPAPRRRRRKWPWVLMFLTLSCLGCCGGVAAWA